MDKLFDTIIDETMSANGFFICLGASLLCGLIIAFAAGIKSNAKKSFLASLVLLPMIVSTVITMVNGNIGTGVAVMGAFSLVRFRSVPGKARDIAVIFLAMTSGLACSGGYIGIAILFTLIVCAVICIMAFIPFGEDKKLNLEITIPESLNFANCFDDIFKTYTNSAQLVRTKTTNMGSLYKLYYKIELKSFDSLQEFIDQLRCRNGNLEISVAVAPEGVEEL